VADLATLHARLEALEECLQSGELSVEFGDRRVTYRSIPELATTADRLRRQIATLSGGAGKPVCVIRVRTSKGV